MVVLVTQCSWTTRILQLISGIVKKQNCHSVLVSRMRSVFIEAAKHWVLLDRSPSTANHVPAHVRKSEESHSFPQPRSQPQPQPRTYKPAPFPGDEYWNRFKRNAGLVAAGVAKNVNKVGNQIKETLEDILYPYRRK